MRSPLTRFRIEAALGRAGVALLVLVFVVPDWIEKLLGLAPDTGDGSVEWGLVLVLAFLTITSFVLAGRTARRLAGTGADPIASERSRERVEPASGASTATNVESSSGDPGEGKT